MPSRTSCKVNALCSGQHAQSCRNDAHAESSSLGGNSISSPDASKTSAPPVTPHLSEHPSQGNSGLRSRRRRCAQDQCSLFPHNLSWRRSSKSAAPSLLHRSRVRIAAGLLPMVCCKTQVRSRRPLLIMEAFQYAVNVTAGGLYGWVIMGRGRIGG